MSANVKLPGVDEAQDVLGLSLEEIAKAARVDYSTLYRARQGRNPSPNFRDRLEVLSEFVDQVSHALSRKIIPDWLNTPSAVFSGKTPREMLLAGRVETVAGALLSFTHVFQALAEAQERRSSFLSGADASRLPLPTIAALAMLDADIDAMVERMQTDEARDARHRAMRSRPSVKLETSAPASEG